MNALRGPERPKLVAFGNVAVGFIAIGNVAVGVVAVGFTVAVGPIAIGMNAAGILLGLGLNAAGTAALAAINALGVFSFAGVNALGAQAESFVNHGSSVIIAALSLCAQIGGALFLRGPRVDRGQEAITNVPLAEIVSGARERGRVKARLAAIDREGVEIAEDGVRARILVAPDLRGRLEALEKNLALLFTLRAELEQMGGSNDADYRRAPQTQRLLVLEYFEFLPEPPSFWEREGILRRSSRASFVLGAFISAATLAWMMLR